MTATFLAQHPEAGRIEHGNRGCIRRQIAVILPWARARFAPIGGAPQRLSDSQSSVIERSGEDIGVVDGGRHFRDRSDMAG